MLLQPPQDYAPATTPQQMEELLRDNLEQDMERYRRRLQEPEGNSTHIAQLLQRANDSHILRHSTVAVLVRRGRVTAIKFPTFKEQYSGRVDSAVHALQDHITRGVLHVPDALLVYNARDEPLCHSLNRGQSCKYLPVFSSMKTWRFGTNFSRHTDLLVPLMSTAHLPPPYLVWYPPEDKVHKAVMRATMHRDMDRRACRMALVELASTPVGAALLDVGFTASTWTGRLPAPLVPYLPLEAHARWRYLASCDGNTASSRLGKLLMLNSVVLKGASQWIEFYYRSMRDGRHYITLPPQRNLTLRTLQRLEGAGPTYGTAIVANANRFACRYLGLTSRVVYWAEAVRQYNELFAQGAIQRMMAALPHEDAEVRMDHLLTLGMQ